VARSLFKSDQLAFAMHLARGMDRHHFQDNEWNFFLGGGVEAENEGVAGGEGGAPSWVPDERRTAVARLRSSLPKLAEKCALDDSSAWSRFASSEEPAKEIPAQVAKRLSSFQSMLVVAAARPDRQLWAMESVAAESLRLKELSPPALSLRALLQETTAKEPVLIVVGAAADPSNELRELASAASATLHEVAMGQGQAEFALEKMREAAGNGQWVFLKNLHLMTFWIPTLEKELAKLEPSQHFRLWLTAEPHPKFSSILTELCLKVKCQGVSFLIVLQVTYEAPPGVKRNLQRTLNSWGPEVFSPRSGESPARAQSLFALAWFHAVVQERRTYIPQVSR